MRSTTPFLIVATALGALLAAPAPASAGGGGTHAATMVYPQYVYHPPYRSYRSRGCKYRSASPCSGDPHDLHVLLQRNPRAYYRWRNLGWNW
jgi:hypothetical protein